MEVWFVSFSNLSRMCANLSDYADAQRMAAQLVALQKLGQGR